MQYRLTLTLAPIAIGVYGGRGRRDIEAHEMLTLLMSKISRLGRLCGKVSFSSTAGLQGECERRRAINHCFVA